MQKITFLKIKKLKYLKNRAVMLQNFFYQISL